MSSHEDAARLAKIGPLCDAVRLARKNLGVDVLPSVIAQSMDEDAWKATAKVAGSIREKPMGVPSPKTRQKVIEELQRAESFDVRSDPFRGISTRQTHAQYWSDERRAAS